MQATTQDPRLVNLVINLSHELGVSLEMTWSPDEQLSLWPEALNALITTREVLKDYDTPTPPVVVNVLSKVEDRHEYTPD